MKLTTDLSLEEFLRIIYLKKADEKYWPVYRFPSEEHLNEYVSTIHDRDEKDIKRLLRHFLPHTAIYGAGGPFFKARYKAAGMPDEIIEKVEYLRRLFHSTKSYDPLYEGLGWLLDLLPNHPTEALRTLDAFFQANCQFLPDDTLHAITDCSTIISAWCIEKKHPNSVFFDLSPRDFEIFIAALFSEMGYDAQVTGGSYDKGIDVMAKREEPGKREVLVIQCKRYTNDITPDIIRELAGTVAISNATKGMLITTSDYTTEARKTAQEHPRIELVDSAELAVMLNANFGPYWPDKIANIIMYYKRSV